MSKLSWFLKYYNNDLSPLGGRVSKSNLKYRIKDEKEMNEFLETFYIKCPSLRGYGDIESEQHYYLKDKWQFVRHINTLFGMWKYHKLTFPKYIWWTIKDIWYIKRNREWYTNKEKNKYLI